MSNVTDTYYAGESILGFGAQIMVGDGASPEGFEAIADVESITPGEISAEIHDKTHLRSPDGHREKKVGLKDAGAFVLKGNWRPTHESQSNAGGGTGSFTAGGLLAMFIAGTEKNFKIVLNDGSPATEWPFRGAVSKFQLGEIGIASTIKFTAEITPLSSYLAALP